MFSSNQRYIRLPTVKATHDKKIKQPHSYIQLLPKYK